MGRKGRNKVRVIPLNITKQIEGLYKALNDSELPDKAELKCEIGCCNNSLIDYYHTVVNEQLYYSSTAADERNSFIMKQNDEQRSENTMIVSVHVPV